MTDALERLSFWVPGVPVPQGSKTAYVRGKRAVLVDANAVRLKPWRATVTRHAGEAAVGRVFTDPVAVVAEFYLPRGRTVTRQHHSVKPDVDKLLRALLDGVTDSGLWSDDATVVHASAWKRYAESEPGVRVLIRAMA